MTKILVVDDEPDVPLLIRQRFRKEIAAKQITFRFAANGVEALEALDAEPDVDIVLSDLNMPEMDGLTLLGRLAGRGPVPKAVVVSAYGDLDNIRAAMNRGAFDFVTKPIDFHDLQVTLEKTREEIALIKQALRTRDELVGLRRELDIAARIQRSLLPREVPAGVEIAAEIAPACEVGGDFYDFFPIDERRLGFAVGDVSGKGLGAALYMAVCRTLLRAVATEGLGPGRSLERLNALLDPASDAHLFVTLWFGVLDRQSGDVRFAVAGHPPGVLVSVAEDLASPDDTARALGDSPERRAPGAARGRLLEHACGPVVGILDEVTIPEGQITLGPGESLVLYTDGVTEAESATGEMFGIERVIECLEQTPAATAAERTRALGAAVRRFAEGAPQTDDITVMTVRR